METAPGCHIFVVDNASTDGSADDIDPKVMLLRGNEEGRVAASSGMDCPATKKSKGEDDRWSSSLMSGMSLVCRERPAEDSVRCVCLQGVVLTGQDRRSLGIVSKYAS